MQLDLNLLAALDALLEEEVWPARPHACTSPHPR